MFIRKGSCAFQRHFLTSSLLIASTSNRRKGISLSHTHTLPLSVSHSLTLSFLSLSLSVFLSISPYPYPTLSLLQLACVNGFLDSINDYLRLKDEELALSLSAQKIEGYDVMEGMNEEIDKVKERRKTFLGTEYRIGSYTNLRKRYRYCNV